MIKSLTVTMPYYKRDEVEYALDFIVRSKIIDNVFIDVVHVDKLSVFFISLKITIESKREIVIDRILGSLEEECKVAVNKYYV